jgi:hypothetical protein
MSEQSSQNHAGIYDYSLPDPPEDKRRKSKSKRTSVGIDLHDRRVARGLLLISLGMVFLLTEFGVLTNLRWWALILVIPATVNLYKFWTRDSHDGGQIFICGGRSPYKSLFILSLGLIFLFNLNFGTVWPIFLILPGLWMLLNRPPSTGDYERDTSRVVSV